MQLKQQLSQLRTLLENSQNVSVFLPEQAGYDTVAGSLGLYFGLLKQGKLVSIAGSNIAKDEHSDIVGIDNVKSSLGGKNMVVTLPYKEGEIEKVSYNFEGEQFNLVIEPKGDSLTFSPEQIGYSSSGIDAEVIFTVGAKSLTAIGSIYHENKHIFERVSVVNIDNRKDNEQFGKVNIVNPNLPTTSEIIALVLKNIGIAMDAEISSNIYKGLQKGTKNFHPEIASALTFEAAALCLRSGARMDNNTKTKPSGQVQPRSQTKTFGSRPAAKKQDLAVQTAKQSIPPPPPAKGGQNPLGKSEDKDEDLIEDQNEPDSLQETDNGTDQESAPADWLKPKIFSSKGRKG